MVPLLEFYFHEDVRRAAVASLPDIIRAAKRCVEQGSGPECTFDWLKGIIDYVVPPLIEALGKEPEVEIQAAMLESLAECAGESGELVRQYIPKMLSTFEEVLTESLERRAKRNERATHEDFDEEEMEALEEEQAAEDEVFDQFAECIGTLLKSYKSTILADIEPLLQSKIAPMFAPDRSAEERRIAICIFDDVFEHASEGGATLKYLQGFADACVRGSSDTDSDVRQASVYG
jgi:importin-5